jgi:hypothetical protein
MYGNSHKVRRMLSAVVLSAAAALFVVPLAQAKLDGPYLGTQPKATQPGPLTGDFMFRDYFRSAKLAAIQANDHILDVSARDAGVVSSGPLDLRGDNMFRDYFRTANAAALQANDHVLDVSARDAGVVSGGPRGSRTDAMYRNFQLSTQTAAAQANDHILDVSAREAGPAPIEVSTSTGTDWQSIGIGLAAGLGGVLLLAGLVFGIVEVRHTKHRLGSA